MATTKNHYYVLVITDAGPKFVTKVDYGDKTAEWDYKEKPLEMSKSSAEDLVLGLNLNMHQSYLVCMQFEITNQPYRYNDWKISWEKREKEENEDE